MLEKGPAKKVTIYVNEETRHHTHALWLSIFEYLRHKRVAGVTIAHSKMSYGDRQLIHRSNAPETAEFVYRIEFIDSAERVDEVLPTLYDMVTDGLIEVQDTHVIKAVNKDRHPSEARTPLERKQGKAKMMRVFFGEADKWHGEPLHDAIVKRLRMMGIAGATVYRGILGYGAKGHTHRRNFFHISQDLPIIDTTEKIAEAAAAVEEMMTDGLIVVSEVDIVRLVHSKPAMEVSDASRSAS